MFRDQPRTNLAPWLALTDLSDIFHLCFLPLLSPPAHSLSGRRCLLSSLPGVTHPEASLRIRRCVCNRSGCVCVQNGKPFLFLCRWRFNCHSLPLLCLSVFCHPLNSLTTFLPHVSPQMCNNYCKQSFGCHVNSPLNGEVIRNLQY